MKNIELSKYDFQLMSKVFNKSILVELAKFGESHTLEKIVSGLEANVIRLDYQNLPAFFERAFHLLRQHYPNEYIYKNAIAEKIVRGRHKLSNSLYVTEFKVNNTIADVAIFNGTSTAYEIKTEFDSFQRLDSQLRTYKKAFEKVYLVVPSVDVEKALKVVDGTTGLYELTDRYSLKMLREASTNIETFCSETILNCLRVPEYMQIISNNFDYSPPLSPSKRKQDCIELFAKLDIKTLHKEYLKQIRAREYSDLEKSTFKDFPKSLTSVLLSSRLNKKLLLNLQSCIVG